MSLPSAGCSEKIRVEHNKRRLASVNIIRTDQNVILPRRLSSAIIFSVAGQYCARLRHSEIALYLLLGDPSLGMTCVIPAKCELLTNLLPLVTFLLRLWTSLILTESAERPQKEPWESSWRRVTTPYVCVISFVLIILNVLQQYCGKVSWSRCRSLAPGREIMQPKHTPVLLPHALWIRCPGPPICWTCILQKSVVVAIRSSSLGSWGELSSGRKETPRYSSPIEFEERNVLRFLLSWNCSFVRRSRRVR